MENKVHQFRVGDLKCAAIRDFSRVRVLRELIANPQEGVPAEVPTGEGISDYSCLLVQTGKHNVLFDAGLGSRIDYAQGRMLTILRSMDVGPGDVDTMVITHADGDHIGGILDKSGKPVFSNACYVLWKGTWDYWSSSDTFVDWPEDRVNFVRGTYAAIKDRSDLVDAESEFLPGLRLVPAIGHKFDHVAVSITSRGERLLHIADGAVHPLFLDFPDLYSIFDLNPVRTLYARFGDVELLGFTPPDPAVAYAPGDALPLTLLWQTQGLPQGDLRLAFWLEGEGQHPLGEEPLGGRFPADQGREGQVVRQWPDLQIPESVPPGTYRLKMWMTRDGQPVPWGRGLIPLGSDLDLGTVQIGR